MAGTILYTTLDSVKIRLQNKVQFQSAIGSVPDSNVPLLQGQIADSFLDQMIKDGETEVEQALRGRYMIPFQSIRTGQFRDLPDHTQRVIRMLCDLKATLIVLASDFGLGTHITADPYAKSLKALYKENRILALGRDDEAASDKRDRFRFTPPLEDLRLAFSNTEADNGFKGKLINTDGGSHGVEDYAKDHINDPSKSYIRRPGWGQW